LTFLYIYDNMYTMKNIADMKFPYELRTYQSKLVANIKEEVRRQLSNGETPKVLIVAPTGFGKTVIFFYLAYLAIKKAEETRKKRRLIVILTHKIGLIQQLKNEAENLNMEYSLIQGAATFINKDASLVIASYKTLITRSEFFEDIKEKVSMVIVDEAHHYHKGNKSAKVFFAQQMRGLTVLGFTATPVNTYKEDLCIPNLTYAIGYSELFRIWEDTYPIDNCGQGLLRPEIYTLKSDIADRFKELVPTVCNKADLNRADKEISDAMLGEDGSDLTSLLIGDLLGVLNNVTDNDIKHVMVFCPSILVSHLMKRKLSKNGLVAKHIDANTQDEEREQVISDFKEERVHVICNVGVFTEGTDIPTARVAVILRNISSSLALYLQIVGRVMRPAPNKDKCVIIDPFGINNRFPDFSEDVDWEALLNEEREVEGRQALKKPKETPMATNGSTLEVEGIEFGDEKYIKVAEKPAPTQEQEKQVASMYDDLLRQAEKRGYKPGWAYYRLISFCKKFNYDVKKSLTLRRNRSKLSVN